MLGKGNGKVSRFIQRLYC